MKTLLLLNYEFNVIKHPTSFQLSHMNRSEKLCCATLERI